MRLLARAVEEAMIDDQPRCRPNQPEAVAGGIEDAARDDNVIPIAAGDGIVAGVELGVDDIDVAAPAVGRAAKMDAVPAPDEFDVADLDIVAGLEKDGVVGGVDDGQIAEGEFAAADKDDRVGTAHFLLAGGIENLIAVDGAGTGNGEVLDALAGQERAMPFAPARFGHEG